MTRDDLVKGLSKYLPPNTAEPMAQMIVELNVHLRVSRERSSKMGDYRSPHDGKGHRISVNHNLNSYAFFITLVHELAHLLAWNAHKDSVDPHGREWKAYFQKLMIPYLGKSIFPEDIEQALARYLKNPAASSCSDPHLYKVLTRYDDTPVIHLDDIPPGSKFGLSNGMVFIKGEKQRTRYRCKEVNKGRHYFVSGIAVVELLD
jgi:SprT protein